MSVSLVLSTAPVSLSERYGVFAGAANTEPSFGLACLGAVALEAGANVAIVEAAAGNLALPEARERILSHTPDLLGLSATTSGIEAAAELASQVKQARPACTVLIGGCHATALPGETLAAYPGFDMVVMREGERTLAEVIRETWRGAVPVTGVPGTAERCDGAVRINEPRELIDNLDCLPLPAWQLLDGFPRAFRPSPARLRRWPCASVVLTRGCPNRCTFCDRSVFGRQCRAYSPGYAVKMIRDLRDRFGVREILIEDDTFIISRARVTEFCDRLLAENLDITWSCLGRADRVTPELLAHMRKAGCWHIAYGIESGDPGILAQVNKNLDIEQIYNALQWSRTAGLRTKGFFMVGFPGETQDSIDATRRLAVSLPLDDISVMLLAPFPGCELYATAHQAGTFDCDWRKMTTIEPVFVPEGFTRRDLEDARARLLREFYLRPRIIARQVRHLLGRPRAALATFRGFLAFLNVISGRGVREEAPEAEATP